MTDPAFPTLHGRPLRGWVNDPNGCSYVDGRYHVFFQYNPDAPVHCAIKWGHMSSTDLLTWRPEPIALVDRPGELDQFGCWTGCVIDDAGTPTAVYSAVADDSRRAEVLLARSDRQMRVWQQGRKSAASMPDDPAVTDVRDPFVFTVDGRRYAVQGAGHRQGDGRILVYGCDDLTSWTYLGPLLTTADRLAAEVAGANGAEVAAAAGAADGNVWECPNLIRFGDRWVLIFSLLKHLGDGNAFDGVRYLVGDLSVGPDGPRFTAAHGAVLDRGPCFYAPQVLALPGRVLMWAWSPELSGHGRSAEEIIGAGWAGALTFCRELTLVGDALVSRPAPELTALRREPLEVTSGETFAAAAFEIQTGGPASLHLVDGAADLPVADLPNDARILVDGSLVEIFDGAAAPYTTRAYPTATSRWLLRSAGHGAIHAWRLRLPQDGRSPAGGGALTR
jgi:beta-fructofuranosidase